MKTVFVCGGFPVRTTTIMGKHWYVGQDVLDMAGVARNCGKRLYSLVKPGDQRRLSLRPGRGNSHKLVNRDGLLAMVKGTPLGRSPEQLDRLVRRLDGESDPATPSEAALFQARREALLSSLQSAASMDELKTILAKFCETQ